MDEVNAAIGAADDRNERSFDNKPRELLLQQTALACHGVSNTCILTTNHCRRPSYDISRGHTSAQRPAWKVSTKVE